MKFRGLTARAGWLMLALLGLANGASADVLYRNGFDTGALGAEWKFSKVKQGQAILGGGFAPYSGSGQLILHDAKNDAAASVAEATLRLDLSYCQNVELNFKAKSLGNNPQKPPVGTFGKTIRTYDGVAVSCDNGKSWRAISSLAAVGTTWESFSIDLDETVAALGGYSQAILIRFSACASASAPTDGLTIDDLQIIGDKEQNRIDLALPTVILEGAKPTKGRVTLSRSSSTPLVLRLSCNDSTGILTLPARLVVPANKTTVEFQLSASNNGASDEYRICEVIASGDDMVPGKAEIGVSDNIPIAISLDVPSELAEGLLPVNNCELRLNRPSLSDTTVKLSSFPAGQLFLPTAITIPAGALSVPFTVSAFYEGVADGTVNVELSASAKGIASAKSSIIVTDAAPPSVAFVSAPTSITEGESAKFTLKIGGSLGAPTEITLQATPDIDLNLPATVMVPAGVDSVEVPFSARENLRIQPVRTGTITATAWGGRFGVAGCQISVIDNDTPGDYDPDRMDAVNLVTLPAVSMAADEQRGLLWLALPSWADQGMARRLVSLDPLTGSTQVVLDLEGEPGQMKLSKNGRYLYVALQDRSQVQRVDLIARQLDLTIPLGTGVGGWDAFAWDFEVLDGDGRSIVVTLHSPYISASYLGVAVFDDAVRRPEIGNVWSSVGVIEPSGDPNVFFGYGNETNWAPFTRLQIEANGVIFGQEKDALVNLSVPQDIRAEGDVVFTTDGRRVDGENFELAGRDEVHGLVLPYLSEGRVIYLEYEVAADVGWGYNRIGVFEPVTFTRIADLEVPECRYPSDLVRWGKDGIAYLSEYGVHVIRSPKLLPEGQSGDVSVDAVSVTSDPKAKQSLQYQIKATNHGAHATVATVAIQLHHGQAFQSATPQSGTYSRSGEKVVFSPGVLVPGGSSTLTLTVIPAQAGAVALTAGITSASPDLVQENNWSQLETDVGFPPLANDSVTTLLLAANDIVEDPVRNQLWVSVGAAEWSTKRNAVVSVNPSTGVISAPISFSSEPSVLAISNNGNYLYVGFSGAPEIQRVYLPTRTPDLVISLGVDAQYGVPLLVEDMEVLAGDGASVLVSRMRAGISPRHGGVVVFDGDVMRPVTTPSHTGPNRIEPTEDPARFVGMTNDSSPLSMAVLQIDASGVSRTMVSQSGFSFADKELISSGELLLTNSGVLMDAATFDKVGDLLPPSVFHGAGYPWLEAVNERAFFVQHLEISAYETNTGSMIGTMTLPVSEDGYHWNQDWAKRVVRWGVDGFAIVDPVGQIHLLRWSLAPR